MIVITGTGRSGTSLLARVYAELGFHPGGHWQEQISAGMEDEEVVATNRAIMLALGLRAPSTHLQTPVAALRGGKTIKRLLPAVVRRMLGPRVRRWASNRHPFIVWSRLPRVVSEYRETLLSLAESRQVVKDPRFLWTLPVWIEARVPIDHVVLTVRDLRDVVASFSRMRDIPRKERDRLLNAYAYGLGVCLASIYGYQLSYGTLAFPSFVGSPSVVFNELKFPTAVDEATFELAFRRIADENLVQVKQVDGP